MHLHDLFLATLLSLAANLHRGDTLPNQPFNRMGSAVARPPLVGGEAAPAMGRPLVQAPARGAAPGSGAQRGVRLAGQTGTGVVIGGDGAVWNDSGSVLLPDTWKNRQRYN